MSLFKFKPTRDEHQNQDVILDLDKLISEPQSFRWDGRVHLIKPITTETFFRVTDKIAKLDQLHDPSKMTEESFIQAYADVFSAVCDTITKKDVSQMTTPQRGALLQYILDCVRGRTQADQSQEKKKTLTPPRDTKIDPKT